MSVIDLTLVQKFKDFFIKNFEVEPKIRSNDDGQILAVAMIGLENWVSVWFDGSENFCLMGNYRIKTCELTKLIGEMEKFFGITDLNAGYCVHNLYALPMAVEKVATTNQVTIDFLKKWTEELVNE